MSQTDTGATVICRECLTALPPRAIVEGTMDENRTGICERCDGG